MLGRTDHDESSADQPTANARPNSPPGRARLDKLPFGWMEEAARSRPRDVVGLATPIGADGVFVSGANGGSSELASDGAESADMSLSDRERAGAF